MCGNEELQVSTPSEKRELGGKARERGGLSVEYTRRIMGPVMMEHHAATRPRGLHNPCSSTTQKPPENTQRHRAYRLAMMDLAPTIEAYTRKYIHGNNECTTLASAPEVGFLQLLHAADRTRQQTTACGTTESMPRKRRKRFGGRVPL